MGASSPYLAVAIGLQLLAIAGVLEYIAEMISKTLLGLLAGKLAFLVNVVAAAVASGAGVGVSFGPGWACSVRAWPFCKPIWSASIGAVAAIGWLITRERAKQRVQLASDGNASQASRAVAVAQPSNEAIETKPHTMSDTLEY